MAHAQKPGSAILGPALSLARREVVGFLRQRSRVIGALGTPLVFWLLLGFGMRHAFKDPTGGDGLDYLTYSFPGIVVLIVLFTAIFSMISIIEDRREGFLQGVLAAPVSPLAIVAGKVLGSTTLAVGQAILFLALAPLAGIPLGAWSMIASIGVLLLVAVELSALGFLIAWSMDSSQGFHAIMNLFLMPMWLLSGAFSPVEGASPWVGWVIEFNPLTYGVAALRQTMHTGSAASGGAPSLVVSLLVTFGCAVIMPALAALVVRRRS